jgi:hypothetical protein
MKPPDLELVEPAELRGRLGEVSGQARVRRVGEQPDGLRRVGRRARREAVERVERHDGGNPVGVVEGAVEGADPGHLRGVDLLWRRPPGLGRRPALTETITETSHAGVMAVPIVLIHSPLLGPRSWHWVADGMTKLGHQVIVPSIVEGASAGSWWACVELAAANTPADGPILVGHSGAGVLLPSIAAALTSPPARLVFVDAGLPPEDGATPLVPDGFAEHLRGLARDGILPPWPDWFGPGAIAELIPDEQRRREVVADIPRVPLSYLDGQIRLPQRWTDTADGAYILLSEVYRPDADQAATWGWPVVELMGTHLDLVNRPAQVASAIHGLAAT